MKLKKVAYNMDFTVYLDIYFMLDTAEVASSSRALRMNGSYTILTSCHPKLT